jgi:hypothetical protein
MRVLEVVIIMGMVSWTYKSRSMLEALGILIGLPLESDRCNSDWKRWTYNHTTISKRATTSALASNFETIVGHRFWKRQMSLELRSVLNLYVKRQYCEGCCYYSWTVVLTILLATLLTNATNSELVDGSHFENTCEIRIGSGCWTLYLSVYV